ncbi:GerMN domain-containing protein [Streptomyces sp. RG80]|uniref:GerMN domain-containing protein n=1 Tax=Streptomyces sp. RG80 TaxID=3157340 RepID=UPI00338D41F0
MSSAPSPARRIHPTVLTAALTLSLLTVAACGSGSATSQGTEPPQSPAESSGTSGGASSEPTPSAPTTAAPTPETTTPTPADGSGDTAAKKIRTAVYFLHGEKVSAAPRTVATPATAASALRALLAGPSRTEGRSARTTAIPSGTALRSVVIRDHIATVDLSDRYDDGGGSLSMRARLAQVVFTVTRFPSVHKVSFEIEGAPVKHLGGEGVVLNGPVGRADFEDLTPAVLVESPMLGDTVRSRLRVWGTADTFEAEFRLKVTDVTGRTAADVQVRATSGTGQRGTFDVTFPYKAVRSGPGLLTAYYVSPEDGRPVTVDTVPLTVNR